MSPKSSCTSQKTRVTSALLLGLWCVVILGFLTISLLSADCHHAQQGCTPQFIESVQQLSHHSTLQIEFCCFFFILFIIVISRPVGFIQSFIPAALSPQWLLTERFSPPPIRALVRA